jgi:Na+-transporting methylmalonyl-CoA/oxaloacetate decarboxylase gamma subunit
MGLEPDLIITLLAVGLAVVAVGLFALAMSYWHLGRAVHRLTVFVHDLDAQDRDARRTLARYERAWRRVLDAAAQRKPHPADADHPVPYRDSPVA